MSDFDALSNRISTLSQGRASAVRMKDGIVSLVLDIGGLSAEERKAMTAAIEGEGRGYPSVTQVRILETAGIATFIRLAFRSLLSRQALKIVPVGIILGGMFKAEPPSFGAVWRLGRRPVSRIGAAKTVAESHLDGFAG